MKYRVWCDDYHSSPEEGRVIEASTPQYAAEKFAQWRDARSADYTIASGNPITVHVRAEEGVETEDFEVVGEAQPVYFASKVQR